ncbi:MAG: redox-sensing transcriptional repressor Rex, partial [Oscillospiraceae bacterium]
EIGSSFGALTVRDIATIKDYCQKHQPEIAVLCIPGEGAASLANTLLELDVKGFWNFSNHDLPKKPGIITVNVHLSDSLASLVFQVRSNFNEEDR